MTQVKDLAQHILNYSVEKDAARLALYQYLRNLTEAGEQVTAELINRFFLRALAHTHWQDNKHKLFIEVASILDHFQEKTRLPLSLEGLVAENDLQVIAIESAKNLETAIGKYLQSQVDPLDKIKVLTDTDKTVALVLASPSNSLRVTVFSKHLSLLNGELRPLHQDFTLFYSPELNLRNSIYQQLEVGPHMAARFHLGPEGVRGLVVRGFTFQRYAVFEGGGIAKHPLLFYPLKKLERLFVNRKSDPVYLELISFLERAASGLAGSLGPTQIKNAQLAIQHGRMALDHIYGEDRILRLMLENLEKSLALQGFSPAPSSVNSPTVHSSLTLSSPLEPKEAPWPEIRNLPV